MAFMRVDRQNGISILRFSHGVTNAIGVGFVAELEQKLQGFSTDSTMRALILTSSNNKFFSIGLDVPELIELSEEDVRNFYHAFTRACLTLLTLPIPIIAVMPGHAIAGGCILALSCDYRLMAEGRKWIGLNEVKLGLPVPYVAAVNLMNLVGYRIARDIMDTGDFYSPDQALECGLVDEVLPADQLLQSAIERLRKMLKNPSSSYALIKKTRVDPLADQIREGMEEIEREFIDCWNSPQAQALLREAIDKY